MNTRFTRRMKRGICIAAIVLPLHARIKRTQRGHGGVIGIASAPERARGLPASPLDAGRAKVLQSCMAFVALTFGIAIAVLGAVGIVVPTVLLTISGPFLTPAGLYAAAGLRLVLGTVLLLAASASRAPKTLRILGIIVVIAGLATPLVGVDRARAIVDWWTTQGAAFMRVWGAVALAFGLLLAYATLPRTARVRGESP